MSRLKRRMDRIENPFIGLRPYKEEEKNRLFGRDKDTFLMHTRVFTARTTLLFAGSGVGKTSFLVAGLIPEIRSDKDYLVCFINKWTTRDDPADQLRESLRDAVGEDFPRGVSLAESLVANRKNRLVLILDQFEEVFATYSWQPNFSAFLDDLTQIVKDERLLVRLVISMREEFLGELSVFDARIPDLFGNYYRLKHLDKKQASEIIVNTCETTRAQVDQQGLKVLIADLLRIEQFRGHVAVSGSDSSPAPRIQDYIVPPYLQLVCREIWDRYCPAEVAPFLASYTEGRASKILRDFCSQKLAGLSMSEQEVVARALDYLVTRQGAKLPYEYRTLAYHMREEPEFLLRILKSLASESTRMLRESNRPDGSLWFELYHDMYAQVLYEWKETALRRLEEARSKRLRELETRSKRLRELEIGVLPEKIVEWERMTNPLSDFWVYLPEFLARSQEISETVIDVMGHNIATKDTEYLYVVEDTEDVARLLEIAHTIQRNPECRNIRVEQRIRVLILRAEAQDSAKSKALTRLLHVANCWIANPRGQKREVYEVAWNFDGTDVEGGRQVPSKKASRIVDSLVEIVSLFEPPTLEEIDTSTKLKHVLSRQPRIVIKKGRESRQSVIPEPK